MSDPRHPGVGKGLSREQNEGLDMVKHIMLSLDEEDGLDQIYTFRLVSIYLLTQTVIYLLSYAKDSLCAVYFPSLNSGNPPTFKVVTSVIILCCFSWLALCSPHAVGMQLSSCACSSKLRGDPWPGLVS